MTAKKVLGLLFLLWGIQLCTGQVKSLPEKNGLDEKYTPSRSSIFNANNKDRNPGDGTISIKNALKFSPTLLIRAKIGVFYERALGKSISVTAGLGKAFGMDFIEVEGIRAFSLRNSTLSEDLHPGIMIKYCEYVGSSPFFTAGIKVFYLGEAFDGAYFNFSYTRERMDYLLSDEVSSYQVQGSRNTSFTMNAFNFGLGFAVVSGKKQNMTHDFYIGFGFKKYRCTEYRTYQVPMGYGTTNVYKQTGTEVQLTVAPSMNVSYIIGFGF